MAFQHGMPSGFRRGGVGHGAAAAWSTAVQGAGGTVSPEQLALITALISSWMTAGVWATFDRVWIRAAENTQQALLDLKALATATNHGAVFTAKRGYAGNGTSAYIDSGFNAATAGGNYTQNSASFGCWVETADVTANKRLMGSDFVNANEVGIGSPNYAYSVNQSTNVNAGIAVGAGCLDFARTGTSATAAYFNGASASTGSQASIALASNNFLSLATSNAGTPVDFTTAREAALWIGGGRTAGQAAAFYAPLRTYMTAVGVA